MRPSGKKESLLKAHFAPPAAPAQPVSGISIGTSFIYAAAHSAPFNLGFLFIPLQYCLVYCTEASGIAYTVRYNPV